MFIILSQKFSNSLLILYIVRSPSRFLFVGLSFLCYVYAFTGTFSNSATGLSPPEAPFPSMGSSPPRLSGGASI